MACHDRREGMGPRGEHPAKGLAGTYGRESDIRTTRAKEAPENQDRVNRQGALLHGLRIKPGYEFSDHGKSGSKDVRRPDVERAIQAVVNQEIEALIVPTVDRLSRRGMRHIGEMLDAVESAGDRIIFVRELLDSSQQSSRAIIAFLAESARSEARNLLWRVETWHEGRRLKGMWATNHPYGYLVIDGKLIPHPEQAPIVRRMSTEVMSGLSLVKIAKALNADGIPSPASSKIAEARAKGRQSTRSASAWGESSVSSVLRNPALAGWQRHNGKIVVGPSGEPVSFGEGILTPGEHARLLAEMDRRTTIIRKSRSRWLEAGEKSGGARLRMVGDKTGGGRPARYLLTGMARCASSDHSMLAQPAHGLNAACYRCGSIGHGQPCPARATIRMDDADAEVMRQLRTRLAAMEPGDPVLDAIAERWRELTMPEDEGERAVLKSRLVSIRGRIVDLEEARYVRAEFITPDDVARWDGMMARLKVQRTALLEDLEALGPPPDFDLSTLRAAYEGEAWETAPLAQRRRLLQIAIATIIVAPAYRRQVPAKDRVQVFLAGEKPNNG
jgi:site-specific DNA recombinase